MNDSTYRKEIAVISENLDKLGLLDNLVKKYNYPDEPQLHQYNNTIPSIRQFTDGEDLEITAGGYSLHSPSHALLKCLMETAERLSAACYQKKSLIISSFNKLKKPALDPYKYKTQKDIPNKDFSWILGVDLVSSKKIYVPAQCVFYGYKYLRNEPHLTPRVSTGAAGGFDHKTTLLRGIYELVERDSFMSVYLAQIKVPKLKIETIQDNRIQLLARKAKRYNLDLMLFDLTTDLKIPVFLGVILDKTGLGPPVSFGLKSSLRQEDAVLGSLGEAIYIRPWMRQEILSNKENDFRINPKEITTLKERGQYWLSPSIAGSLNFLFDQKAISFSNKSFNEDTNQELRKIIQLIKNKNIEVFYINITPSYLKNIGCYFYKVISPNLQPMYFYEKYPDINIKRVRQVSKHFNKNSFSINKVPHPFL